MIITERIKEKLRIAKEQGFDYVSVIVYKFDDTTYVQIYSIEKLLEKPIGENTCFYVRGMSGRRRGISTKKQPCGTIKYSHLFGLKQ